MNEPVVAGGDFVGMLETTRGWRVADGDVLVVGINRAGYGPSKGEFVGLATLDNVTFDENQIDRDDLQEFIDQSTTQLHGKADALILVTVADDGPKETKEFQDHFVRSVREAEKSVPVVGEYVVDRDRSVWQVARNGLDMRTGDVSLVGRVPDDMPLMVGDGMAPNPAPDRESWVHQVDPHPEPTFEALRQSHEMAIQLSQHLRSPGEALRYGVRCLDGIADNEGHTQQRMQVVAHLANHENIMFRDGLIAAAVNNEKRTQALIETSRCAPAEQRPTLQIAAAAARTVNNANTPVTRRLLELAEGDKRNANLATLTEGTMWHGGPDDRERLGRGLQRVVDERFEQLDAVWRDQISAQKSGPEAPLQEQAVQPAAPDQARGPELDL